MKLTAAEPEHDSKWRLGRKITLHVVILLVVCICFPVLIQQVGKKTNDTHGHSIICYEDGSAHLVVNSDDQHYQAWVPSLYLSITLGFGGFTFSEAKGIDIVWDLVVGRGGQIILAALIYPLFRRTLAYSMEMQPVSYRLFSCLAFGRVSVPSLYALSLRRQEAGRPYHWPVTTLRPWLYAALLSMGVYILAFPTIVSIMTGYQSNFAPYASDPDNPDALLPIGHLDMPDWVVRDGDRLDFAELYPVYKGETGYDLDSESDFITLKYYVDAIWYLTRNLSTAGYADFTDPSLFDNSSQYKRQWQFELHNETVYLPAGNRQYGEHPTGFALEFPQHLTSKFDISSNITLQNLTAILQPPPLDVLDNTYHYEVPGPHETQYFFAGNKSFTRDWLLKTALCEPEKTYKWGFSAGMLLLFACASGVYAGLFVVLHWVVHLRSRVDLYEQSTSVYGDVLDLADELNVVLGEDARTLRGAKLDEKIREMDRNGRYGLGGVQLDAEDLAPSRWRQYKTRRKQGKSPQPETERSRRGEAGGEGSVVLESSGGDRWTAFNWLPSRGGLHWRAGGAMYNKARSNEEGHALDDTASGQQLL